MGKLLGSLFGAGMPDFNGIIEGAYEAAAQGFFLYGIIGGLIALVFLLVINLVSYCRPKTLLFKIFNIINFIYIPFLLAFVNGKHSPFSEEKYYLPMGDMHWNSKGHLVVAEYLFENLEHE